MTIPFGLQKVILTSQHADKISALLRSDYKIFPKARCCFPSLHLHYLFEKENWIGVGIVDAEGTLVGCSISRPLGKLQIVVNKEENALFSNTGMVDFFCIRESWRSKGAGSFLLQELVYETAKVGRDIHLFIKEGFPLLQMPPIWQSSYIWRNQRAGYKTDISVCDNVPLFLPTVPSIRSFQKRSQSKIYRKDSVFIAIHDTFHRSVPEGWRIGEIDWIRSTDSLINENTVEEIVDNCGYDVVIADNSITHTSSLWNMDVTYQVYIFNVSPGLCFRLQPELTL